MAFVEDPTAFLSDFGVTVTSGQISGLGILDAPGEYVAGDRVITTEYLLRALFADFGALHYGDGITVDGVNYEVREVLRLEDGVFVDVLMTKLAPEATAPGGRPRQFGLADLADVDIDGAQDGDVLVRQEGTWIDGQDDNAIAAGVALS